MASTSDQQVPRLFMFMHKVCLPVVRTYFNNVILSDPEYNNNFKTFLEYHKHEIYHLYASQLCCKCQDGKVLSYKKHRLFQKQFDKVYTLGSPDRSHMSYKNGTISIHCSCGLVPNEKCSTKELDMTALYAILKTCVPNLDTSHAMWLDKIVEERHNLCHMSDMMTENETLVMWSYLEGSILGLASDIPPKPLYGETIETQVELLKDGNYSFDTVRPVIDAIRLEIAEQNNNMNKTKNELKEIVQQTTASLQETISVQVEKVSSEMKEVVEKQSIKFVESMEKTKCDIVSAVDELKGISCFRYELFYSIECCGEYTDFALVRKKSDGLTSLSSTGFLRRLGQNYLIVFLFKKTEQETSTALMEYINECNKETIIVLFDHAEIPNQLRAYHIIQASEDDSTTYKEIIKAIEGRSKSFYSDDEPDWLPFRFHNRFGEKQKLKEDSMKMVDKHLKMTKDMNTGKIKQAVNKTDLEEDTSEVQ